MGRDLLALAIICLVISFWFFKPEGSKADAPYLYELAYTKAYHLLENK